MFSDVSCRAISLQVFSASYTKNNIIADLIVLEVLRLGTRNSNWSMLKRLLQLKTGLCAYTKWNLLLIESDLHHIASHRLRMISGPFCRIKHVKFCIINHVWIKQEVMQFLCVWNMRCSLSTLAASEVVRMRRNTLSLIY